MLTSIRPLLAGICALVFAVGVSACAETASTSKFSGESSKVAQTVSNFQTDATAEDEKKLCEDDLATTLTAKLARVGGCQPVLKAQLHEIDALGLTIESISVNGTHALAHVKSTYSGKSRISTFALVKEGTHWKISGLTGFSVAPSATSKKS
ncbi:MAG TPA: hypothetical protein VGP18_08320 [Solirubrobacteraceae bacterium]|jgi:hypothetical protein|nr:hypothetical protein [Solirubrobacteraceae bacterium]